MIKNSCPHGTWPFASTRKGGCISHCECTSLLSGSIPVQEQGWHAKCVHTLQQCRRTRQSDATKKILSRESRCGQAMERFRMTRENKEGWYLHQRCVHVILRTMSLPLPAIIVHFVHSHRHSSQATSMKYFLVSKTRSALELAAR
jgi:hypothetical protein